VLRYPGGALGRALAFLEATPHLPWDDLVDADFPLEQAREALTAAAARSVTRAGLIVSSG
jgi:hypothetical protein